MKATIKIELSDGCTAAMQVAAEAPTLDMLKESVIRTVLLQLPNLVKHVFDKASQPEPEKPKELESGKETVRKAAGKSKKPAKKVLPPDIHSGGESTQTAPAAIPGAVGTIPQQQAD